MFCYLTRFSLLKLINPDPTTIVDGKDSPTKFWNYCPKNEEVVFVLWGKKAQEKVASINLQDNSVIKSAHPSPFSANNGFFGSKPFSKVNQMLREKGLDPVDWKL